MSGYRRFISYIYAYSLEGKGRNVGFAKVEVRGDQKLIGISLSGVYRMEPLHVSLFWRNGTRVELLPFNTIGIHTGNAQAQYVLNNELFREYGRGMEDAAGIILYSEAEETYAYATIWDEEPFSLEMMNAVENYIENEEELQEDRNRTMQESSLEEVQVIQNTKSDMEISETEEEENQELESINSSDAIEIKLDSSQDENEAKETEIQLEDQEEKAKEQRLQEQILQALLKKIKGEEENEMGEKENILSAAEIKEPIQEEGQREKENEERWEALKNIYPKAEPFQAQEEVECLKIKPGSIGRLPRQTWIFANNNFVLYGYMKYHYLVLAKMGNTYFLGVPGKYNPNVKMLAEQFGFENFYPVEENRGYWCVPILYPKGKEN